MSWHGQINRTIWEIQEFVKQKPDQPRYRRELLRAHFLQHFEFDKAFHVPRDDRSFLFLQEGITPACLLVHGAQGTPAEMRELGSYLYSRGFTVYCPRFSRTNPHENFVSWESWLTQAQTALETLATYSEVTFVAGLSLGGTIGMILSQIEGVTLNGLVLLAPAVFPYASFRTRLYQVGRVLLPTLFYRIAGWNGEVLKAMDYARRNVHKIGVPVLALQAADDRHLSHRGLKFIRRHVEPSASEVALLPHGAHVLTRGPAKDEVFERIHQFLAANSRVREAS